MREVIENFERTVESASPALSRITEAASGERSAPGKWSPKELLGHLIDSAANNHQRFVRVQLADGLSLPGYEQEEWVRLQGYRETAWRDLVELWRAYNLHLLRVVALIPAEKLSHQCSVKGGEPVTLRFLVEDYVRHLQHHLRQILG